MNKFKLTFSGQLLENTDRQACIDGLAKLFDKTPDAIESKLFSGKQTVIKITTEQHVVDYYTKAFNEIGARLLVRNEFMGKYESSSDPAAKAEAKKKRESLPVRTIVQKGRSKKKLKTRLLSPGNRKKLMAFFPRDKKKQLILFITILLLLMVLFFLV